MKEFKEILLEKLKVSGNTNYYEYTTNYWDRDMFERMITFIIYYDDITDSFFKNNPEQKIPFQCIQIHHITDQMVQSAPKIKQILPELLKFIEGSVLIGHNINFDLRFLNAELERNGFFQLKNSFIDTLSLSRWSLPEMQKYNQSILAEYFNIKIKNAHRAEDDAYVCGQIFLNCIKVSAERQKIRID